MLSICWNYMLMISLWPSDFSPWEAAIDSCPSILKGVSCFSSFFILSVCLSSIYCVLSIYLSSIYLLILSVIIYHRYKLICSLPSFQYISQFYLGVQGPFALHYTRGWNTTQGPWDEVTQNLQCLKRINYSVHLPSKPVSDHQSLCWCCLMSISPKLPCTPERHWYSSKHH